MVEQALVAEILPKWPIDENDPRDLGRLNALFHNCQVMAVRRTHHGKPVRGYNRISRSGLPSLVGPGPSLLLDNEGYGPGPWVTSPIRKWSRIRGYRIDANYVRVRVKMWTENSVYLLTWRSAFKARNA